MSEQDHGQLAFGTVVAQYVRGRPSYPSESVSWLLAGVDSSGLVADVGAGTGKLSAVIRETGRPVIAVDPDPDMLAAMPTGIETRQGTGEQIPLLDGEAAAVTFGQSWHWVDPVRGSVEVARVLRRPGVLGLLWNIRDNSVDWVAELTRIAHSGAEQRLIDEGGPTVAAPFGDPELHQHRWSRAMTLPDIEAMVRSRSYLIKASEDERTKILAELGDLLRTHPETAGRASIEVPYITHTFRYGV